jgi:hypothetical protein
MAFASDAAIINFISTSDHVRRKHAARSRSNSDADAVASDASFLSDAPSSSHGSPSSLSVADARQATLSVPDDDEFLFEHDILVEIALIMAHARVKSAGLLGSRKLKKGLEAAPHASSRAALKQMEHIVGHASVVQQFLDNIIATVQRTGKKN